MEGKETSRDVVAYAARLALGAGGGCGQTTVHGRCGELFLGSKKRGQDIGGGTGGEQERGGGYFVRGRRSDEGGWVGMAIGRNIWQSDDPCWPLKKLYF